MLEIKYFFFFLEKFHQRWLFASFPSGKIGQTSTSGLHHQDTAMDLCTVFQGKGDIITLLFSI